MKFVIPIVSVWDLAKDIAANGHGEESQLLTWLMAEARRGAFPIYDTANGEDEIWVTSLVEVGLVRPFLIQAMGRDPLEAAPMAPVPASVDAPGQGSAAPVVQQKETKEERQDNRLQACIDAGLPMDTKAALSRLPDGVGGVANRLGLTRQAFAIDVKAALNRRDDAKRAGATVHRA